MLNRRTLFLFILLFALGTSLVLLIFLAWPLRHCYSPVADADQTDWATTLNEVDALLEKTPVAADESGKQAQAVRLLDGILCNDGARSDIAVKRFYQTRMERIADELSEPVPSGLRIWAMYNLGFVVKTSGNDVFAFDLVNGYPGWEYRLPDRLVRQVKVLFVSHFHADHNDPDIVGRVTSFGNAVVASQSLGEATVCIEPGQTTKVAGLEVEAIRGYHLDTPLNMYRVKTAEGGVLLFTGDNQISTWLPSEGNVDVLLFNGWVNEGGPPSLAQGVREVWRFYRRLVKMPPALKGIKNCIERVAPRVAIPGHFQEMAHAYDPQDVRTRAPYSWALDTSSRLPEGLLSVLVFGDRLDVPAFGKPAPPPR